MKKNLIFIALLAASLAVSPVAGVLAAALRINPIRVGLSAQEQINDLDVTNVDQTPVTLELKLVRWTQQAGHDDYTAVNNQALVVTPPVFKIPPEQTQIVRIGLMEPVHSAQETAYRLFIQQVPINLKKMPGVANLILRISLPVFIAPDAPVNKQYVWQARPMKNNKTELILTNEGNVHIQIGKITLKNLQTGTKDTKTLAAYLLPGQQREWSINLATRKNNSLALESYVDSHEHKFALKTL